MNYLLDVNVLVAWGWADHPHHLRVDRWMAGVMREKVDRVLTSSIGELGFVRVSVLRNPMSVSVDLASGKLSELLAYISTHHEFLPDDLSSCRVFPAWCENARNTTDAHLFALAQKHGLELATLDAGIPGAFVIPG